MLRKRASASLLGTGARTSLARGHDLSKSIASFARRKPLGATGGVILLALVIVAIIAPLISPFDVREVHVTYKYAGPGTICEDETSCRGSTGERLWLGGDQLGRDTLSRLVHGARISLYVSLISVGIGVTAGALIGIVSAYFGGVVDLPFQRLVDTLMGFPAIILALAIVAVAGASMQNVILALIIIFIPGASRIVRSQAMAVKERDFILAARALGATNSRIMLHHIIPNCMAPYIVFATANLGVAIVVEASLSFLGVGTPPDIPSWGSMLSITGGELVSVSPWLVVFPSITISLAVFGFNLLGDAVRDVLDPRLRGAT
ncbi:MAG: ABC transporter permease [Dehalococcoidia bacterium]|nr:ABC transporter permease [Dehalococcoidia bacterium]